MTRESRRRLLIGSGAVGLVAVLAVLVHETLRVEGDGDDVHVVAQGELASALAPRAERSAVPPVEDAVPLLSQPTTHCALVGTSVRGLVVDAAGRPVADATVTSRSLDGLGAHPPEHLLETTTDAGGAFTLDPPPGRHRLMARLGDRVSALAEIDVRAAQTTEARLALTSPAILVHVRDESNRTLANVRLGLRAEGESAPHVDHVGWSDALGDAIVPVGPGAWTIQVAHAHLVPLDRSQVTVGPGDALVERTVFLGSSGTIEGDVVGVDGQAVAGARVTARVRDDAPASYVTSTDEHGRFALRRLARATAWLVSANRTSDMSAREEATPVRAAPGGDPVRLTLRAVRVSKRIVIEVVGPGERPVTAFTLTYFRESDTVTESFEGRDGRAEIEVDAAGTVVEVAAEGYARRWVTCQQDTRIRLEPESSRVDVRVTVIDADRQPVADAVVRAIALDGARDVKDFVIPVRSDANGVAVLGLTPGTWAIVAAESATGRSDEVESYDVAPGSAPELTMVLREK